MPWSEVTVLEQRQEFVLLAHQEGTNISDLNPIEKLWANLKRRWRKVDGSLEEMIKESDY